MKLKKFAVSIPEGKETQDGYVQLTHATQYTIQLHNGDIVRCDAEVYIDEQRVGIWRVDARSTVHLERPAHDTGRFTFYEVGTPESSKAGIRDGNNTGRIRVLFKPEEITGPKLCAAQPKAGGTGLSGRSDQRFTSVEELDYDESGFVTINLRLVSVTNEPRPLFPSSTPVPPPVGRRA